MLYHSTSNDNDRVRRNGDGVRNLLSIIHNQPLFSQLVIEKINININKWSFDNKIYYSF